jgi:mono/diheme cytochrome c family protein/heme/copper-type cytochrome/quinol oxidase subunit 3
MTSDGIDSAVSPFDLRIRTAWRGLVVPGWLFAILAPLLFGFLILFGLLIVVSITYSSTRPHPDRVFDLVWALLSLLALLWAVANLHWLTKAAESKNVTAAYGHLAITIGCGLIALGIHSIQFAQTIASQPIVMDYSDRGAKAGGDQVVAAVEGDAEEGRKIFSTTCLTCHGPTGGGMPNLAPSLRGSSFIASSDAATIGNLIRLGRAATDPTSKTKKVMPARGGNPFLGDDKIAHLVAFVQAIQNEAPSAAAGEQSPDAPPPVQLAKWVVPTAPAPPIGMVKLVSLNNIGDANSIASRSQQRRFGLVRSASLGLTGIHCLLLIGVMMASSSVLIRELLSESLSESSGLISQASAEDRALWSWSVLGWGVATIVWLVVFLYAFVVM